MAKHNCQATFIAPDMELQAEHQELLRKLQPLGDDAYRASLSFASFSQLRRYQEKALRLTNSSDIASLPYWLRSHRERRLLGCMQLMHREHCASAKTALDPDLTSPWSALLPALAKRAELDGIKTLDLSCTPLLPSPPQELLKQCGANACSIEAGYRLGFAPESARINLFDDSAEFYELDLSERTRHDLPFYLRLCRELMPRNILELACGSGRVAFPLLEAGFAMTVCDHSTSMLRVLRRRLSLLPSILRSKMTICEASLTTFAFGQRFDLILVPFRSLQMICPNDLAECLRRLCLHLHPEGYLAFDMINPDALDLDALLIPEIIVWEESDPIDRSRTVKKTWCDLVDRQNQQIRQGVIWEVTDADGTWHRFEDVLRYSYYTPAKIIELLQEASFDIVQTYGDFTGSPLGHGKEIIVVAKTHPII